MIFNRNSTRFCREGQISCSNRQLFIRRGISSESVSGSAGDFLGMRGTSLLMVSAVIAALFFLIPGCTVKYGFSGASLSPEVKSISIQYFQNMAPLVQPGLSQYLTDEFTDKVRSQTNKEMVRDLGDVNFEGEIVDYRTAPQAVSGNATASVNRFTISVRVRYTNSIEPDFSFEQTFTRFEDYDSSLELSSVEQDLTEKIVEQLIEDIFNRAFVNW